MRLVRMDGDRRLGLVRLRETETLLGRDADADVVVRDRRASRRHALIEPYEDTHSIRDLGSGNGTTVNGHSITTAVLLTPGDEIQIGDTCFLYEEGGAGLAGLVPAAAIAAGLLVVVGIGWGVWSLLPDGPMGDARVLALEAIEASRAGRPLDAKRSLNGAVAVLLDAGALDDVPPTEARRVGLQRIQESLEIPVDLLAIYQGAVDQARAEAVSHAVVARPRRGPCRTDAVSERDLGVCIRERAEQVLVDLWQDPREIPESFYSAVDEQFRLVLSQRRDWVVGSLERGNELRGMMEQELEAAKMPSMLRYLSMIESGFQARIRSKAGARGLWQFMPATARSYGLKVSGQTDERTDPRKSTRAAARYLRDLAFEFGGDALLLAIASYNKGENGIRRALKKLDDPRTDRSYWTLVQRELLPAETQDYVPRLVAAAIMGEAGLPPESVLPPS